MKKTIHLLILAILCGTASLATAQTRLAGTTWQTVAYVPTATDVIFRFKKDSVMMLTADGNQLLEMMTYTQKAGEWTWVKVSGGSSCAPGAAGTYAFTITGDEMTVTLVNDPCRDRVAAMPTGPFKKVAGQK